MLDGTRPRWRGRYGSGHVIGRRGWRSRAGSEQAVEPRVVERRLHAPRLAQHGGPQLVRLHRFAPRRQAARLEQHPHERLEVLGARVTDARLPLLDRAPVRAQAVRKLALGQARSPAVAQQQPTKGLGSRRGIHAL